MFYYAIPKNATTALCVYPLSPFSQCIIFSDKIFGIQYLISFTFIIYLGTKWVSSDKTGNRHTLKNNDSQKQQKHFGAGIFRSASQSRLVGKLVLALLSIRFAWNFYQMISGPIINLRDFKEKILDLKVLFVFFYCSEIRKTKGRLRFQYLGSSESCRSLSLSDGVFYV